MTTPSASSQYETLSKDMIAMAIEAGQLIDEALPKIKKVQCKQSVSDMLTETDLAVEALLKKTIFSIYPSHKILAEESANYFDVLTDDPTWIIDPVDGTMNFAKTNPYNNVSIGFAINRVVQVGVVYMPFYKELFHAIRGKGAKLVNLHGPSPLEHMIHVAQHVDLPCAMINTGFNISALQILKKQNVPDSLRQRVKALENVIHHNFHALLSSCVDIRRTGASALECCWVACGRLDASFEIGNKEWDLAAGSLIVHEAGGTFVNLDGSEGDIGQRNYLMASSKNLCNQILDVIKPYDGCIRQLDADIDAFNGAEDNF